MYIYGEFFKKNYIGKMHSTVKKITSLLALLLVAIPLIFSIFSVVKLAIIRYQASAALESEQLKVIRVTENDIKWVVPGKEILIRGNLFDVNSWHRTKDGYELTGLYDEQEDNFQAHVAKILHQKPQGNSTTNTVLVTLMFQTLFTEKNAAFQNHMAVILLKKSQYNFTESLVSANSDILIPPPKA